jgi:hypothetical protein
MPWVLAAGLVPHLVGVYRGVASRALLAPLTFGLLWGIAQVTFGLRISAMGLLWLSGMVGYEIGATLAGMYGTSLGYALFITAMILSSNFLGILRGEWRATSAGTRRVLATAVVVILISALVLNLGGL